MGPKALTALITGASGGIGYELAKLFAGDHYNLVLAARSGDRLNHVACELREQFGVTVKTVTLDLAADQAVTMLFEQLKAEGLTVDVLVNNAGFGVFGDFAEMAEQEVLGQIQLNVTALTHLTRLFLPAMIAGRQGKIMNVASTAAFQPGPLMAVYYATKAYVLSFSEALANEVAGTGVVVSCLCPGATDTNFQKRAGMENSRLFKKIGAMNAEKVARDGYRGLMAGKTLVISGTRNWLVAESVRFAPRKLVTAISRWVAEKVE
ncbi:MAG: SDR family oxidoreductase [Candidatus Sulfotelmatobacter sp.]